MSVLDRLLSKIVPTPEGCWLFQGYRDLDGYGRFWMDGKQRAAHRVAYELIKGPIPPGLVVDHQCVNRHCVNPAHVELATPEHNVSRRRTCDCGVCPKCRHREYVRGWYHRRKAVTAGALS